MLYLELFKYFKKLKSTFQNEIGRDMKVVEKFVKSILKD